jgi:bacterioferritin (cytochrome b1)
MATDPRLVHLFSYYRDAELRGATLLLKLIQRVEDAQSQINLVQHLADETRHAWLWTKRIRDLGGSPVKVDDGYQIRIGRALGVPKTLPDLFALTVVVEQRAYRRYLEHARRPGVDAETLMVLEEVTKDEKWHIGWIRAKLEEMLGGDKERAAALLDSYREADKKVFEELAAKEREAFGFSFSDSLPG